MEKIMRILFWLRIFASPLFGFGLIAFGLYKYFSPPWNIVFSSLAIFIGIVFGILMAENARKKKGTIEFMSRVNASPDFDKTNKDKK